MITRLQIIESMNPTLSNAIYLANMSDLTPQEQTSANHIINTCLSNIDPNDLTDADKRLVLTLLKAKPQPIDQTEDKLENYLTPEQIAKIKSLSEGTYI